MLSYSDQTYLSRIERRISALEEALAKLQAALADMQLGLRVVMGQAGIGDVMIEAAPSAEERPPDAA